MNKIEIRNITKRYKKKLALDNISFDFKPNAINVFSGPNESGKTTLLNIFANRIFANKGHIYIDGNKLKENDKLLEKLYFTSNNVSYYDYTLIHNIAKNIQMAKNNFDMDYFLNLCDRFNININKFINNIPEDERTFILNILNLATNCEIMIFDDSIKNLDSNKREQFYKILVEKHEDLNNTIILTTDLTDEIANIVEYVIIICDGKLILEDSYENIDKQLYKIEALSEVINSIEKNFNIIKKEYGILYVLDEYPNIKIKNLNCDIKKISFGELNKLF